MNISARRLGLLGWLAILLSIYALCTYISTSIGTDYGIFYSSLKLLMEGKSIYAPVPIATLDFIDVQNISPQLLHPNLNPPIFTLLLAPLGLLPYAASFWAWSLLSLAFGFAGVFMLMRAEEVRDLDSSILILLLLGYFPTFANIMLGQTGMLVFMLVAGGWAAARAGNDRASGALLGLAVAMKIFLGLFLVYFLVQRRWKLLLWLAATFAACWLIGLMFLGLDTYAQYNSALHSITWHSSNWNASAYGFFTRIFGGSENLPRIDYTLLGQALSVSLSLLLLALVIWLARIEQGAARLMRFDLGFSFTLVASLLISPLGWMYYFPVLFIPFLTLFRLTQTYACGWSFKGATVIALLLSDFPHWFFTPQELTRFAFTTAAVYTYALVMMAVLLVWASRALTKQTLPPVQERSRPAGPLTDNNRLLYVFLGFLLYYAVIGMLYGWGA